MRLLTQRIYRAFPELDRYGEEQCERFIRAAKRGRVRAVLHGVLITIPFCLALAGAIAALAYLGALLDRQNRLAHGGFPWDIVLLVLLAIPLLGAAPLSAFVTRDRLLRRRVRYVLRARGICHGCHYSLIGLPVGRGQMVTCPECGTESEVDASLGELVLDQAGQARYQPSAASLPKPPRIFTPARVRKLKRVAIVAGFLLGVGLPASWGVYEWWLRAQADQAARERPGPTGMQALVDSMQPADAPPESPNAWEYFNTAELALEKADGILWRAAMGAGTAGPNAVFPDFSLIGERAEPTDPAQRVQQAAAVALALKCLDTYRADGVFDQMRQMASCRRAALTISFNVSQPSAFALMPELGHARNMARINAGRMRVARGAGDLQEFADAAEANFALARMCRQQPFLIDALVSIAIDALTFSRVREVLLDHPDAGWLDAIDGVIARQGFAVPRDRFFEGERLSTLDTVAWTFSNPAQVRRGRFSPTMMALTSSAGLFGGGTPGRLGTFVQNRDELKDRFDNLEVLAAQDRWARTTLNPDPGAPSGLILINVLMPAATKALQALDISELDRRGHTVMSALERFRLAHGEYPAQLSALVPGHLSVLPLDPWSGKPFGYKRLEAVDAQGRGYLLYSVGKDGVDDGGAQAAGSSRFNAVSGDSATGPGIDFVINEFGK